MRSILSLIMLFLSISIFAQETKKTVLLEHFTNTRCGICANKNPAFFDLIQQYPDDVIHVAFHHPFPYTNCELYLFNKDGNEARSSFYNFSASPRLAMNGEALSVGGQLLQQAVLESAIVEMSPVGIELSMNIQGSSVETTVNIEALSAPAAGDYKLYVMIVEKELAYSAPNGEDVHYNVFRNFVSDKEGDAIDFTNFSQSLSYITDLPIGPDMEQLVVIAYIQNITTGEMMNAGTSLNGLSNLKKQNTDDLAAVYPNPVQDELYIKLQDNSSNAILSLSNVEGKVLLTETIVSDSKILVNRFIPGVYFIKIETDKQVQYSKLLVK